MKKKLPAVTILKLPAVTMSRLKLNFALHKLLFGIR
jgi:hypothetical protein